MAEQVFTVNTNKMELKNGIKTFYAKNRKAWRKWLERHHATDQSVWLIIYRKQTGIPSVYYSEAVEEALCFGWIDSKPNKRDEESFYQFFSVRKPKSVWSLINKKKIDVLLEQGLMTPAGLAAVEVARQGCISMRFHHLSKKAYCNGYKVPKPRPPA
jgi:uncharacterized protein YdeI (YjbR/CyaY-like superfamily)